MANAATAAPLTKEVEFVEIGKQKLVKDSKEHNALTQKFDRDKNYVFQLAAENMELEKPVIDARTNRPLPHKPYKPYQNLIMTSQIVWNGGRVGIRYYDGCESIFISEQPKEKEIVDQFIQQTRKRGFNLGKLIVEGYDSMLLLYLSICSWNTESPFRTSTANGVFYAANADKKATKQSEKLDLIEQAMKFAREATKTKMYIHSAYLGIPLTDYDSGNELTEKELRTEYRTAASRDPKTFIESYGNKSLEVKYYIDKALEAGIITNKHNPNKATWGSNNTEICDISGLKSSEAIAQRLFEFSKTEDKGEEFLIQLKAISESN